MNRRTRAGASELQMVVCFSPNLIHSKSRQPNEGCSGEGSLTKTTSSEARATQKPFSAAPWKGNHFLESPETKMFMSLCDENDTIIH